MRSRAAACLFLAFIAVVLVAAPAGAVFRIGVVGRSFDPAKAPVQVVQPGDTFKWAWKTIDAHNVEQDDGLFDSGATVRKESFSIVASAGSYPYHCQTHAIDGMTGLVRVRPAISGVVTEEPMRALITWAVSGNDTGDRFDVRYRVDGGDWTNWFAKTERRSAVFGKGNNPVDVEAESRYSIAVRSRQGKSVSGWSPPSNLEI